MFILRPLIPPGVGQTQEVALYAMALRCGEDYGPSMCLQPHRRPHRSVGRRGDSTRHPCEVTGARGCVALGLG